MDERRISDALRAGPPDEPRYEVLGWSGLRDGRTRRRTIGGGARAALRGLVTAVLVVALLLSLPLLLAGAPDRLGAIVERGELRFAVTTGSPQVLTSGRLVEGFDMDVAQAVGRVVWPRLEVTTSTAAVDPAELARGDWAARWDVAFDSALTTPERAGLLALGRPYATRSGALLVPDGSGVRSPEDLAGRMLCVTPDGPGAAWLRGALQLPGGRVAAPPPEVVAVQEPDLAGCIGRVRDGSLDGMVADWELDVEPAPAGLRRLDAVPWTGLVSPAVARSSEDPSRLIAAVDAWIEGLRDDGTLAELARRRFGGRDLTTLP